MDERRGLKLLERCGNDPLIRVIGIHDGMFEGLDPIAQSARGEGQRLIDAPVADPDPHFGSSHQFLPGGDPHLGPAPVPVEDGGVHLRGDNLQLPDTRLPVGVVDVGRHRAESDEAADEHHAEHRSRHRHVPTVARPRHFVRNRHRGQSPLETVLRVDDGEDRAAGDEHAEQRQRVPLVGRDPIGQERPAHPGRIRNVGGEREAESIERVGVLLGRGVAERERPLDEPAERHHDRDEDQHPGGGRAESERPPRPGDDADIQAGAHREENVGGTDGIAVIEHRPHLHHRVGGGDMGREADEGHHRRRPRVERLHRRLQTARRKDDRQEHDAQHRQRRVRERRPGRITDHPQAEQGDPPPSRGRRGGGRLGRGWPGLPPGAIPDHPGDVHNHHRRQGESEDHQRMGERETVEERDRIEEGGRDGEGEDGPATEPRADQFAGDRDRTDRTHRQEHAEEPGAEQRRRPPGPHPPECQSGPEEMAKHRRHEQSAEERRRRVCDRLHSPIQPPPNHGIDHDFMLRDAPPAPRSPPTRRRAGRRIPPAAGRSAHRAPVPRHGGHRPA